ncbi:hypothetical protein ACVWWG_009419 [Bradyrhizobium sp. LB7.2]
MTRMVVDTNCLQAKELRDYLLDSPRNRVVVTPFVELEMLKGDAPVNVIRSTEILAEHAKQVVLTKDPMDVARLKGRRKGMKKRLSGGKRTSTFRKWSRNTRKRAERGDPRSLRHIDRRAAGARAQLADMRQNAETFQQNIDEARKRYTKEELEAFRAGNFTPALIEKIRVHVMEMTQQFFESHPDKPDWPPRDDIFHTFTFRFALCARLHAISVIANSVAKDADKLPNDFIDVSVAAYATCFDGLLSKDKLVQDIYRRARFLLDEEFLKVPASPDGVGIVGRASVAQESRKRSARRSPTPGSSSRARLSGLRTTPSRMPSARRDNYPPLVCSPIHRRHPCTRPGSSFRSTASPPS